MASLYILSNVRNFCAKLLAPITAGKRPWFVSLNLYYYLHLLSQEFIISKEIISVIICCRKHLVKVESVESTARNILLCVSYNNTKTFSQYTAQKLNFEWFPFFNGIVIKQICCGIGGKGKIGIIPSRWLMDRGCVRYAWPCPKKKNLSERSLSIA